MKIVLANVLTWCDVMKVGEFAGIGVCGWEFDELV